MNRRLVLKQLAMATAGAMLLPACGVDQKKVSIALNHLKVTGDEEDLLADIADTMIPATNTPGAKTVGAHLFTLVMVDDCLSKEEQEKYLSGLRSFNDKTKELYGKSFTKASPEERLQLLSSLEKDGEKLPEDLKTFYSRSRQFIVQGYTSSQHFLTDIKPYQLIPGPDFKGCTPVTEQKPA
ncbi:gluconate 2-dehydrogenase subunit 3 family protein [Ohtaekwangia sp.]|uniref:gluconate 2-dehydrogenase subunit 3 family protein n=1 Tax=Ohtaekwangia sp. TaxID=2066019 RepID=UPI002FDEE0B3